MFNKPVSGLDHKYLNWMKVANTLAYYDTAPITAVKRIIEPAQEKIIKEVFSKFSRSSFEETKWNEKENSAFKCIFKLD